MVSRSEKNKELLDEIKEEKKVKKRRIFKKIIFFIITLAILVLSYSHFFATKGLVIREYKYQNSKLPNSFIGKKIVHFTDFHYKTTVNKKDLDNIVNSINSLKPDIVVFTGDLLDKHLTYTKEEKNELTSALNKIDAILGKYIVSGNHDYRDDSFNQVIANSGFIYLDNKYELVYNDNTPILISGISSSNQNKDNINEAFAYYNEENPPLFTIMLLHEPDTITNAMNSYNIDLAFAGHSHNGQVRLPFIGSLKTVKGAKKYYEEHYKINNTDLFISGGIGTSGYPFRLFNRPSINLYRLYK